MAALLLTSCAPAASEVPTPTPDLVSTMVAATLSVVPSPTSVTETPSPSPTIAAIFSPTPGTGEVTGRACYPSGSDAMTAYFENTSTHQATELALVGRQPDYTATLQPGTYIAYAWLNDFSQGGSYSRCGTDHTCNDATPLVFPVLAGEKLEGIDLCDWSHGPFDIPYPPGHSQEQTTGAINGSISGYPFGSLPALTVVAFNQGNGYWYWVGTVPGQSVYTITELPPGSYQVVAYDEDGHAGGSAVVTVEAGETVNADVGDWRGGYPENPAG